MSYRSIGESTYCFFFLKMATEKGDSVTCFLVIQKYLLRTEYREQSRTSLLVEQQDYGT